ncbi:hypothetical protein QUB05_21845 [Microcoleus sp. F10-C6]|uniref:hypothetical protein n=1 Tax=unclassified Microcoleus TaxID=2642155 RepID=UPI002FD5CE42
MGSIPLIDRVAGTTFEIRLSEGRGKKAIKRDRQIIASLMPSKALNRFLTACQSHFPLFQFSS